MKIEMKKEFKFPNVIDLRDVCNITQNQNNSPDCVGYSVAGYLQCFIWKHTHIPCILAPQKIYEIGRNFKCDSLNGTKPEYCFHGLRELKVVDGDIQEFYSDNIDIVKYIIHEYGVFCGCFNITTEWYHLSKNNVIEKQKKPKKLGGHCVLCCGYNKTGVFIQNSWGFEKWGRYGYAVIPWELIPKQLDYCCFVKNLAVNMDNLWRIT